MTNIGTKACTEICKELYALLGKESFATIKYIYSKVGLLNFFLRPYIPNKAELQSIESANWCIKWSLINRGIMNPMPKLAI